MLNKEPKKTISILLELGIYALVFFIAILFFPICNFYYLGEEERLITKPQYLNDYQIAYAFIVYFVLVFSGFLSLKKWLVTLMNSMIVVLTLITLSSIQIDFMWWGSSPIHPSFGMFFLLSQLCIIILIMRTFRHKKHLPDLNISKKWSTFFFYVTIGLSISFIIFVCYRYYEDYQRPRFSSESEYTLNDRNLKTESWDYMNSYGARITKYYSKAVYKKGNYQLDSVTFDYYDENSYITKQFTKKAVNGKVDIEAILDENEH